MLLLYNNFLINILQIIGGLIVENNNNKCLICRGDAHISQNQDYDGTFVNCQRCGRFSLTIEAKEYIELQGDNKFYACAYYYFTHFTHFRKNNKHYLIQRDKYDNTNKYSRVTVDEIMNLYPKTITERINMILLNLVSKNDVLGENFTIPLAALDEYKAMFFLLSKDPITEFLYLISMLHEINYITNPCTRSEETSFAISYNGWQRIDELQKQSSQKNQGFIAMWFPENKSMDEVRNAIKDVFRETGYQISIIDEKQHNNQIVPEILYEIQNSDFIVADLTGNRNGVYYEAGYALGLGKPVILTILTSDEPKTKDDHANAPHFDVAQINQIRYKDVDDLKKQLFNRITATVGNLKNPSAELKK